jgi:O-antigen ligase
MKHTGLGVASAVVFALLPFFSFNHLFYGDVNAKFFLLTFFSAVAVLVLASTLLQKKYTFSLKGRYSLISLGLLLLVQYVSTVFGVFPERSLWSDLFWSSGVLFITHLALLAIVLSELLNAKDWSLVRKWIAVSSAFFALLTIVGKYGFGVSGTFLWVNLEGSGLTLGNETYAGAYLLIAFIFGLIEYFRADKKSTWRRVLLGSLIVTGLSPLLFNVGLLLGKAPLPEVFEGLSLLLGNARASSAAFFALLGFLAGYGVIRKFVPEKSKAPITYIWSALVLVVLVAGTAFLFTPGSAVQNAYIESSSAARPLVWQASWNAFVEKPYLGWGPENFNHAFEEHFDNRLFQEENLAEIWFERAHNVFIDTLVAQGIIGVIAFTLLTACYVFAVYRARRRELISHMEAVVLYALVPAHLLQMQTGFDTIASYTLLALALGYALSLEKTMAGEGRTYPKILLQAKAIVLVLLALCSFWFISLGEYGRQMAIVETMQAKTLELQKQAIEKSLARISSFETLRLSYGSFVKGSLASMVEAPSPQKTKVVLEFLTVYEGYFKEYLAQKPDHYRARMNYAYLLLIKTTLGENRVEEAKEVIRSSYALSEGNPLTYIMDSTAELYSGNLKEADRLMQEALAINPEIEFTKEAVAYLEAQKKNFPNISVLKMGNL